MLPILTHCYRQNKSVQVPGEGSAAAYQCFSAPDYKHAASWTDDVAMQSCHIMKHKWDGINGPVQYKWDGINGPVSYNEAY